MFIFYSSTSHRHSIDNIKYLTNLCMMERAYRYNDKNESGRKCLQGKVSLAFSLLSWRHLSEHDGWVAGGGGVTKDPAS